MPKCSFCDKSFESSSGKWKHENIHHKNIKPEPIKCPTCNRNFVRKDSFKRHKCSIDNVIGKLENQIKELKDIIIEDKNQITINNNFKNNNFNIVFVSPTKEDLKKLTKQEVLTILNNEMDMILSFIQIVNFNPRLPEYRTIKNTNLHGNYIQVYNAESQVEETRLKKHFYDELFTKSLEKLRPLYEKYSDYFNLARKIIIEEKMQKLKEMNMYNTKIFRNYLKLINTLTYDNFIQQKPLQLVNYESSDSDDSDSSDIEW